jgi:hypothetical protein
MVRLSVKQDALMSANPGVRCCFGQRYAVYCAITREVHTHVRTRPEQATGRCRRWSAGAVEGRHGDRQRTGRMQIERSLPLGHVVAALGMLRKIALDRLILSTAKDTASRRNCDLVVAMIVDRLITPRSKLGFVRAVDQETATSSLGAVLRLGEVKEREAYEALDWLLER